MRNWHYIHIYQVPSVFRTFFHALGFIQKSDGARVIASENPRRFGSFDFYIFKAYLCLVDVVSKWKEFGKSGKPKPFSFWPFSVYILNGSVIFTIADPVGVLGKPFTRYGVYKKSFNKKVSGSSFSILEFSEDELTVSVDKDLLLDVCNAIRNYHKNGNQKFPPVKIYLSDFNRAENFVELFYLIVLSSIGAFSRKHILTTISKFYNLFTGRKLNSTKISRQYEKALEKFAKIKKKEVEYERRGRKVSNKQSIFVEDGPRRRYH